MRQPKFGCILNPPLQLLETRRVYHIVGKAFDRKIGAFMRSK